MSFRFVSKSVTLNDLERRNGRYFAFFSANSVAFGAHCVKTDEDIRKLSATEMYLTHSACRRGIKRKRGSQI